MNHYDWLFAEFHQGDELFLNTMKAALQTEEGKKHLVEAALRMIEDRLNER